MGGLFDGYAGARGTESSMDEMGAWGATTHQVFCGRAWTGGWEEQPGKDSVKGQLGDSKWVGGWERRGTYYCKCQDSVGKEGGGTKKQSSVGKGGG